MTMEEYRIAIIKKALEQMKEKNKNNTKINKLKEFKC